MKNAVWHAALIGALLSLATGQTKSQAGAVTDSPSSFTSTKGFVLEDGAPIRLRLKRTISSSDSHVGDTVDFEALQDVRVNGITVVPKGALAFGTVSEVQGTRKLARAGKLEINLNYVCSLNGEKVRLRASEGGKGRGHAVVMTAGLVATGLFFFPAAPSMLFIHGRDFVIPKGAEVTAYVAGNVTLDQTKFEPGSAPSANLTARPGATPHTGYFLDRTYTNEYFQLVYRLTPDWVLDTDLARKTLSPGDRADDLLLAAVHIPQDLTDLRADASLSLLALPSSAAEHTQSCTQYLDALTAELRAHNRGKPKGEVSEFTVAGHDFLRAGIEYFSATKDRAVLCSPANGYLLVWKLEGSVWESVENAASTVYAIDPWPPESFPPTNPTAISEGTAAGLLRKKVQPVYPLAARENSIQGKVRMQAVLNQKGDIESLELLEGPIELVPSAVTAIRQWKYRSYLLNGKAVPVTTQIAISYAPGPG